MKHPDFNSPAFHDSRFRELPSKPPVIVLQIKLTSF